MPIRVEFEKELTRLHKDIIKMGAYIEESLAEMITVIRNNDINLAKKIIENDDRVDELERKINQECLDIIARQQPIATDLRDVMSILRIVSDLERIADHCEDISEYVIKISQMKEVQPVEQLDEMAAQVSKMITDVIDAYVHKDIEIANKVIDSDDIIDSYFDVITNKLIQAMEQDNMNSRVYAYYLFIIKYFERMGDHATNIAYWVKYFKTGKIH